MSRHCPRDRAGHWGLGEKSDDIGCWEVDKCVYLYYGCATWGHPVVRWPDSSLRSEWHLRVTLAHLFGNSSQPCWSLTFDKLTSINQEGGLQTFTGRLRCGVREIAIPRLCSGWWACRTITGKVDYGWQKRIGPASVLKESRFNCGFLTGIVSFAFCLLDFRDKMD